VSAYLFIVHAAGKRPEKGEENTEDRDNHYHAQKKYPFQRIKGGGFGGGGGVFVWCLGLWGGGVFGVGCFVKDVAPQGRAIKGRAKSYKGAAIAETSESLLTRSWVPDPLQ